MEYLTLTGRFISVIAALIAALSIAFFRDVKYVIDHWEFKKEHFVIIGILSSPENFESRSSIRDTWVNFTSDFSLSYHFVVGKNLCDVHPSDRLSPYTCVENQLTVPENVTSETEFSVLSRKDEEKNCTSWEKVNAIGFGFQTVRSITIKKIGIVRNVLDNVSEVRVKLRSTDTLKTLASVTIARDLIAEESDFILKSIPPLALEQNKEAQLIIEFVSNDLGLLSSCDVFQWSYTPGVINYLQLIQFGDKKPWPFTSDSCSYVSMNYTITDVDMLKNDVLGMEERRNQWRKTVQDISIRLKNESDYHGDITFVDVVDVYRNLPKKLIQFFRRITETELFHYVVKTDDDSFTDVERVYQQLVMSTEVRKKEVSGLGLSSGGFWWWSKYRESWKVQETGKWREDEYRSAAYPSFPCGGGYVLSKEIVDYLCKNEMNLRFFQGEDVSMGIWLSPLKTVQHHSSIAGGCGSNHSVQERIIKNYQGVETWLEYFNSTGRKLVSDVCEWTCDNGRTADVPQCNRVQLNPTEMRTVWEKYIRQGFV